MDTINAAIASKQGTIPATFTVALGFQAIWDTANLLIKGLVVQTPILMTSTASYLKLALDTAATYTMGVLTCTGLATVGSLQCNSPALFKDNLTVNGNINVLGTINADAIAWVGGRVYGAGVSITTTTNVNSWTLARSTGQSTGYFRITFSSAHPIGNGNYSVFVTGLGGNAYVRATTAPPTSTYFEVVTTTPTGVSADVSFSFMVMNW